MKTRKLRIGVIGTGGIARGVHLPSWREVPGVEIVAVADIIPERAEAAANDHGVLHVFDNHRDLLKLKEIDAVDVCTPNLAHTPVVLDALAAKKHVLCEKPLAVIPKEIRSMIQAAKKARRILCVIQNNRFRSVSQAIKAWIDDGNLGKPYYARSWAIRRNLLPTAINFISKEKSGGGPCMDIGVHCLDLALWLMGMPEPVSVTGAASHNLAKACRIPGAWGQWDPKQYDVEDFACGMVRFATGAMLSLESSWLGHTPEAENLSCMILGDKAGVSWPSGAVYSSASGTLIDSKIQAVPARDDGHALEIRAFHDAIVNRKPSPVPADQALKVIRILDGVYRSQKLGREVKV